ncbi:plasminogen activator inhibitor 1 RNA-binding protein-like [Anopheles darlingi]|uniref:Putative rna-binding protein n=1 Tax=Anopheles darlingi TaxID=43151 RepID=A0A2M4CSX5_ANODA|nr:plasminogen activator inhibitor 1 RNA-binding protein-like [Anopheles darlingi]
MENTSYGINVANRYDLFCIEDDAGDPIESILKNKQKQQQKKQQAQQSAGAAAPTPAAGAQPQQQQAAQSKALAKGGEKENKAAGAGSGRGAENRHPDKSAAAQTNGTGNHLHNQRGGGASGPGGERRGIKETQKDNIRNQENQKTGAGNQTSKFPRGGGGGGAGGPTNKSAGANDEKYPRKPRDSDPDRKQQPYAQNGVKQRFEGGRGKRELDRQSGSNKTGIKAVDKRDGAGSHNWGSSKQDAKEFSNLQEQDYQAQDADTSAEEKPQTDRNMNGQAGEGETGDAGNAKSEDEAKEMTLDEWKAQKAAVRLKPQYNLRKAGEGENSAQWDKMVALNKKADGEDDEGNDTQKTTAAVAAPAGGNKNKQVLDIEFHFNDNRRGGLGRGRGGGRGGKGGPRGAGIGREGGPGGRREYGGGENNYRSGGEGGAGGYEHRGGPAAADGGAEGGERPPRRNNRPPGGVAGYEGGVNKYSRPNPRPPKQHFVAAPKVDDEHDFPSLG